MSLTRSIAHNTLIQAVGRFVSVGLTLVVFLLVARHLGVADYGQLVTATAFLQLFSLVVDLGLYIYLTKTLGEPGVDAAVVTSNVFSLRIVSAVCIVGLAPLIVMLMPYPPAVKVSVGVMAISFIAATSTQALSGIFQHALRTARFIVSDIIGRVVLLAATVVAIQLGAGIVGISATVSLGSLVTLGLTILAARRLVPFRFSVDLGAWRKIFLSVWPIALSIALNVVYFKVDTLVLSWYHSSYDVGLYGAPFRILEALISIPAMISGLLTPLLATAYLTDRARFGRLLQRGLELLLFLGLPMVIGTQFIADDVMRLVAPEFSDSGSALRLLMVATFSIFIGYLYSNTVVVVNKQRAIVWAYAIGAVVSVGLCFAVIPRWSYLGAAGVAITVQTFMAAAGAWVVYRTARTGFSPGLTLRMLAAGAVMAVVMWLGRPLVWELNAMLGLASYALASFSFGVFNRQILSEVFSRQAT